MAQKAWLNINGSWRETRKILVNISGVFKDVMNVFIKKDGQWIHVWRYIAPVPVGTIIPWAGTAAEIPTGWVLCDGTNGTPNLIDRFVMGGVTPGATGGSVSHSHTSTSAGAHTHSMTTGAHRHSTYASPTWDYGRYRMAASGGHEHTVSSAPNHNHGDLIAADHLPLHYALAFIMRV